MSNVKYKHKFNVFDMYDSTVRGLRAFPFMILNRIKVRVNHDLIERLMLATTEVNGCEVCSYAHTKMALQQGFSQEEIDAFLSGSNAYVKESEANAILFAQHYADSKARPDKQAYVFLQETYGKKEAIMMVKTIQIMMMANLHGLPLSALLARLKGKPYENSTVLYELDMLILEPIVFVLGLIDATIRSILRRPFIRFEKSPNG
ncbi:MAG: carboxymuconolactone decarboxylase family protein [Acholeplasmataceae bacterium]|nr:carboxymuconolactone decarboxylase family protein [Acholeplasmataceae bacterium]